MLLDIIVIVMVYFVQGILGLFCLVVSYFFKDDLYFDLVEVKFLYLFQSYDGCIMLVLVG